MEPSMGYNQMDRQSTVQDSESRKNQMKKDSAQFESPKRMLSILRTVEHYSTAIAKSPFSKLVGELEPLPEPFLHSTPRSALPREMTLFRTPDKELLNMEAKIAERLDFDALGVSARKPELDVIEGRDSQEQSSSEVYSEVSVSQSSSDIEVEVAADKPESMIITIAQPEVLCQSSQQQKELSKSGRVCCNCKKSRCLKLYCDCFRNNQLCEGCNCVQCLNTSEHCPERYNAVLNMMETNPQAFQPKIELEKHTKGCNCKKSFCLKKYCECYQAGLECSDLCRCEDCKNTKPHDHMPKGKGRLRVKASDS